MAQGAGGAGGEAAEQVEVTGFWEVEASVGWDEFEDHGGDLVALLREQGFEGVRIIEG